MKELLDSARQDMLQTADGQPIRNLCPAAAPEGLRRRCVSRQHDVTKATIKQMAR